MNVSSTVTTGLAGLSALAAQSRPPPLSEEAVQAQDTRQTVAASAVEDGMKTGGPPPGPPPGGPPPGPPPDGAGPGASDDEQDVGSFVLSLFEAMAETAQETGTETSAAEWVTNFYAEMQELFGASTASGSALSATA